MAATIGFREVQEAVEQATQSSPDSSFANFSTAKVGDGNRSFHMDRTGLWVGGKSFSEAPFSVDMDGNVTLLSITALNGYDTTAQVDEKINVVQGNITIQASRIDGAISDIAALSVRTNAVEISVGRQGGANLLKNSVGLKGTTIDEWGSAVTIVRTDEVLANTESHSALYLDNDTITQTFPTIVWTEENDIVYSIGCRFKRGTVTNLVISGVADAIPITVPGYVDETWETFIYTFKATAESTTITISNTGAYAILGDLIVKKGEITGWEQAPNEMYGQGFRFDQDGLRITDSASTFYSQLDENGLTVVDTSDSVNGPVIAMQVDKDSGKVNNLVAQSTFTVQRYENSSSSIRFIPTATGMMVVVND